MISKGIITRECMIIAHHFFVNSITRRIIGPQISSFGGSCSYISSDKICETCSTREMLAFVYFHFFYFNHVLLQEPKKGAFIEQNRSTRCLYFLGYHTRANIPWIRRSLEQQRMVGCMYFAACRKEVINLLAPSLSRLCKCVHMSSWSSKNALQRAADLPLSFSFFR